VKPPQRDHYTRYPRPILWLIPEGPVQPFYISKVPVTNEQFEAFDPGFLRSPVSAGDRDPATGVSWHAAVEYCEWYAEIARKPIRLPTEAEWDHACRAGTTGRFFFDDPDQADDYLWDAANSDGQMQRLEDKKANGHGLFGILGGVWEWTETTEEGDEGEARVVRGGSFRTPREETSCAARRLLTPDSQLDDVGFRIVKSLR